ncbi:hypothetical protein GOP47_0021871 [Adiantum capillus-veneris]|uniref:Uncharacterized protein n=1 Tax=Adiantum capillus-veneris TaxID=13818 RepID=A0A9D4Z6L7_ADICA|nr:hypothetical protein GOP47_0021871 [Adiantum capillus-veneris]
MSSSLIPDPDSVRGQVEDHQLAYGHMHDTTNGRMRVATPPSVRAISGSLGGAVEACCLQPIDSIKTRLQLDTCRQYRGIMSCGKSIVQHEGVRALWKGLIPYSTHLVLKHTMRMGSNAVLQGMLRDPKTGTLSCANRLVAGFGAGISEALLIVTPCEVIKIRLQQQRGLTPSLIKYKGPINCALTIVHEEGVLGLWAGVTPTLIRNGINQAVMFTAKSTFDTFLWGNHEDDSNHVRENGCVKYKGMFHALRSIYVSEGLPALWKGLLPRLLKIPPGQAIMWTISDQVVRFYQSKCSCL